jgi:hypothetical protein
VGLQRSSGKLTGEMVEAMRREPPFVHVQGGDRGPSESRWAQLFKTDADITGNAGTNLADYISQRVSDLADAAPLAEQIAAVRLLRDVPTARLERLFAEHIDCASYRLDAWILGFCRLHLESMRAAQAGPSTGRQGIHLGAFGWLEDVRPKPVQSEPVHLHGDL